MPTTARVVAALCLVAVVTAQDDYD
eukprot:SAG11_NODE_10261_length_843_cov_1.384409_1_plen_24_part_01